jgi:hypothetical protein
MSTLVEIYEAARDRRVAAARMIQNKMQVESQRQAARWFLRCVAKAQKGVDSKFLKMAAENGDTEAPCTLAPNSDLDLLNSDHGCESLVSLLPHPMWQLTNLFFR